MKKVLFLLFILILIGAIFIGIPFYDDLYGNKSFDGEDITFTIPEGSSTHAVAKILKENNFIKYEKAFVLRVKRKGVSDKIKYGTFTLNTGLNKDELINALLEPGIDENYIKVTIPEGYSVEQIATKLEELEICSKDDFLNTINNETFDYDFLENVSTSGKYKLQGFLFPKTYSIKKGTSTKEIIDMMLKQFEIEFNDEYYEKAKELNKTIPEIITIASIIEREAKLDSERATISGVIYNRLKISKNLEIDATVQYDITNGLYNKSKIYYEDLQKDSKYNTYKNYGLPVGPICNPGKASIEAALSPEKHSYLYYVVNDEEIGSHKFSETYKEHVAN